MELDASHGSEVVTIPTWKIIVVIVPLGFLNLSIVLGNILVIATVITQKFLRTVPNLYLVSLATADLLVGLIVLPFGIVEISIGRWTMGKGLCEFWLTADVTLCTVSIFHLCVIAVDRYRSVTDGVSYLQRRTTSSALWTICLIWLVTLWISSPPILGWNDWDHGTGFDKCELTEEKGYIIHSALGSFIFPLILLIVLYTKIYREIQKRLLERRKLSTATETSECDSEEVLEKNDSDVPRKKSSLSTLPKSKLGPSPSAQIQKIISDKIRFSLTRERRAAKILFCIMLAFVGCWLPFGVMYMLLPFLPEGYEPSTTVYHSVTCLGYLNSALNPIIYTVFNPDFRKGYKGLVNMVHPYPNPTRALQTI